MNSNFNGLRKALCVIATMAAMITPFIVGCCSSDNSKANSKDKVVLEFWNTMEGREAKIMPEVLAEFHKQNPDIRIEEVSVNFYEAREKFTKSASEGKGPDLMRADRFWLDRFVQQDLLTEIDQNQLTEELADMVPIAREIVTFNDKIWAVPLSVDSLAMFYNKAHFREKSLKVPTNFDEFSDACIKLTDSSRNRYGFFVNPNGWYFEPFFFGFGGQYFDPSGNLAIKSDAAKKALEFITHLKEQTMPATNMKSKVYNLMINSFANGQISVIFTGSWAIRDIIAGSAFKDNNSELGVEQIPAGPSGTFSPIGCQSLVISKNTKNKEAAIKFAKFMFSYEVQKSFTMANYGLPARRKVFAAPELKKDPYLQTFIRQLQMSRKAYTHPDQGDIYAPLGNQIIKVLSGELSIDFALSDVETEWKAKHK